MITDGGGGLASKRNEKRRTAATVARALNLGGPNSALRTLTLDQINQLTPEAQAVLRNTPVVIGNPGSDAYYSGGTVHLAPGDLYTRTAFHEIQHVFGTAGRPLAGVPEGFSPSPDVSRSMSQMYGSPSSMWNAGTQNLRRGEVVNALFRYAQAGLATLTGGVSPAEVYATLAEGGAFGVDPSLRQFYPQFTPAAFNRPSLPPPTSLSSLASRRWSFGHGR